MRTFFRDHWKAIVGIVLLVVLALLTVTPSAAIPEPSLAERLRAHVSAIASAEHGGATPAEPEAASSYIGNALAASGYRIRRQAYRAGQQELRNIEASIANLKPGARPARIFIVGARLDPAAGAERGEDVGGSGAAAVLELARLLKDMRPSQGTEVKFVFFVNEAPPAGMAGSFIAFVGSLASSRQVQDALAAFRNVSDFPAHGLAAAAYVQGMTLSDRAPHGRFGYPAIMITDTGFMRYPYYKMHKGAEDTPDRIDYEGTARVVSGLARTITALAAGART